jgi:hypothetical protein
MVTFRERLADFISDRYPDEKMPVEVLCKDNKGTYVVPYACCRFDGKWRNFETDEMVTADIIGWRPVPEKRRYRALRKK